jgi:hypothetical protein
MERSELLSAVERAAGDEAVELPNGKRLEIIYND